MRLCRGLAGNDSSRLRYGVFGLCLAASWMLLHLYRGITQDGTLYVMQGLAHLRPQLYGNDIFLRYGSQDRFTLFGPICALTLRAFGVDHAAALLTAASQIAFFLAAWTLGRAVMSRSMALLGVGLLVALELPYGAQGVFHVVEDFLSARPLSEALVLWGTCAVLARRDVLALLLMFSACLIHPLMGCAGFMLLIWVRAVMPRPGTAAVAAALIAIALVAAVAPMDEAWFHIIQQQTPYLLLSQWSGSDWSRAAAPLATLWIGMLLPVSAKTRALASAALGIGVTGLMLALIFGDGLHRVLILQAQVWRWMWLTVVIATLLFPAIAAALWACGLAGRSALAVLTSAYLVHDTIYGALIALLAVGLIWRWRQRWRAAAASLGAWQRRFILCAALGVLALGLAWEIATRFLAMQFPAVDIPGHPGLTQLRRLTHNGFLAALALVACWWIVFHRPSLMRLQMLALCALLACAALWPVSVSQWTRVMFAPSVYQAFSGWRNRIPEGTEVLWAENPLYAWIYLERVSYISVPQLGSSLFSRSAAVAMRQRLLALQPFLFREHIFRSTGFLTLAVDMSLADMCARSNVRYVVTRQDLDAAPIDALPADIESPYRGLQLYECSPSLPPATP